MCRDSAAGVRGETAHGHQPLHPGLLAHPVQHGTHSRRLDPAVILCMGRMANCYAGGLQRRLPRTAVIATMRTGKRLPLLFRRSLQSCRHVVDTYEQGGNALLVSGYEWHIPASWTPETRAQENQNAWGGGWARSREQPNGDTENVFFLVFEDSHRQPEFNLGYTWTTYWLSREGLQPGLGFTAAIIQRPDIANGWPVPVVLPLFTLRYQTVNQAPEVTTAIGPLPS